MIGYKTRSLDLSDYPLSVRLQKRRDERRTAIGAAAWGGVQSAIAAPGLIASFPHVGGLVFFGTIFALGIALMVYGVRDARIAKRNEELER